MNSNLFGSGVPKFVVGETEYTISNSYVASVKPGNRTVEHESIINSNRNWVNIADHDHLTITVIKNLHRETDPLSIFKSNLYAFHNTEVDALFISGSSDAFVDKDGNIVKFRMQITEYRSKNKPTWAYDTLTIVFKSKKPVNLTSLTVTESYTRVKDTAGTRVVDTAGTRVKDSGD